MINKLKTAQTPLSESYVGIYQCHLRGAIVGTDLFETILTVDGGIIWQNGKFVRGITNTAIRSDRRMNGVPTNNFVNR